MILPASVSAEDSAGDDACVRRFVSGRRPVFARPKSATFTRPRRSSRMFSGLMSRWTMPWSCANCSASQICGTMASASRGGHAAACEQLPQVHAVHKFHEEIKLSARLAEFVKRDDAGMIQLAPAPWLRA